MKVFIGRFGHESNTFATTLTSFEEFSEISQLVPGEKAFEVFPGTGDFMGGIVDKGKELGVEMIATIAGEAVSPRLSTECLETAMGIILKDLNACKDEIDGICFCLHGAGCAVGIDDLDDYVLSEFRKVVGDEIPIVVPLDLHGNISPEMAEKATLLGGKLYPHTDCAEIGAKAMEICVESIKRKKNPNMALVQIPVLLPCSCACTDNAPFPEILQFMSDYCKEHDLLDATMFHGFPYADSSSTGVSVTVASWNDNAEESAKDIARFIWSKHSQFVPKVVLPDEALDIAEKETKPGYIVINELSDNPGAGAPGDGTHLLRELLKRDLKGSIFGFILDPVAVQEVFNHRIGERIKISIGGKTHPLHGDPVVLEDAEIISMSDGRFIYTTPTFEGLPGSIGPAARLRYKNVDIIIASIGTQTYDDQFYAVTGANINDYRYVCLKSMQQFRGYFESRACRIIPTDPPGICSSDVTVLPFEKVKRPIYPLDDVDYSI